MQYIIYIHHASVLGYLVPRLTKTEPSPGQFSSATLYSYLDKLEDELKRNPNIDVQFRALSKRIRDEYDERAARNEAKLKSLRLPDSVKIRDLLEE